MVRYYYVRLLQILSQEVLGSKQRIRDNMQFLRYHFIWTKGFVFELSVNFYILKERRVKPRQNNFTCIGWFILTPKEKGQYFLPLLLKSL